MKNEDSISKAMKYDRFFQYGGELSDSINAVASRKKWPGPWFIYALSKVCNRSISILFPALYGSTPMSKDLTKTFHIKNTAPLRIMWSSHRIPENISSGSKSKEWQPNHFVPLVPKSELRRINFGHGLYATDIFHLGSRCSLHSLMQVIGKRSTKVKMVSKSIEAMDDPELKKLHALQSGEAFYGSPASPITIDFETEQNDSQFEVSVSSFTKKQIQKIMPSIDDEVVHSKSSMSLITKKVSQTSISSSQEDESGQIASGTFPLPLSSEFSIEQAILMICDAGSSKYLINGFPIGDKSNRYMLISKSSLSRRTNDSIVFDDDCGKFIGSRHTYLFWLTKKTFVEKKGGVYFEKCRNSKIFQKIAPQPNESEIELVYYYKHTLKDDPKFVRKIIYCRSKDPILVQYVGCYNFEKQFKLPTNYNAIKKIKENINEKPTKIYRKLIGEGEQQINLKQIYNAKSRHKAGQQPTSATVEIPQEYIELEQMVDQDPFVREYRLKKKNYPTLILYSDDQIKNMKSLLSSHDEMVIGIDRTFNLSFFYATVTVFKNYKVTNSRGCHPIFIGPVFLHRESTFEQYSYFLSVLKTALSMNETEKDFITLFDENTCIGSDQERALTKAIANVFPRSKKLHCYLHLKENMVRQMTDIEVCKVQRNEI